jgi:hypothetical protein
MVWSVITYSRRVDARRRGYPPAGLARRAERGRCDPCRWTPGRVGPPRGLAIAVGEQIMSKPWRKREVCTSRHGGRRLAISWLGRSWPWWSWRLAFEAHQHQQQPRCRPTPTATPAVTATPTATATAAVTSTPTPSPSSTPTATPQPAPPELIRPAHPRVAIFKGICDSIGQQNTCNGRDTSLDGYTIDFYLYEGVPTEDDDDDRLETITVTLREGNGSQGRELSDYLEEDTLYTVCEIPLAHPPAGSGTPSVQLQGRHAPTIARVGATSGSCQAIRSASWCDSLAVA